MAQTNPCLISTPSVTLSVVSGTPNLLRADVPIPTPGSGAGQALGQLASSNANGIVVAVPPGSVWGYAGATIPTGFLACDGTAVSRTTYANLFGVVGTAWGAGDGSTTFNLPDLRGRSVIGDDPSSVTRTANLTVGSVMGESAHVLTISEMPSHDHALGGYTLHTVTAGGVWGTGAFGTTPVSYVTVNAAGSSAAHNNMPPYAVVNWMVAT